MAILTNENYVKKAEEVIEKLSRNTDRWGNVQMVTTSKIRNLLSMSTDIYNEVRVIREDKLNDDICGRISYLKIRFVYEAGRDRDVKTFVKEAKIIEWWKRLKERREYRCTERFRSQEQWKW